MVSMLNGEQNLNRGLYNFFLLLYSPVHQAQCQTYCEVILIMGLDLHLENYDWALGGADALINKFKRRMNNLYLCKK